jgi:hypothetical protein
MFYSTNQKNILQSEILHKVKQVETVQRQVITKYKDFLFLKSYN